MLRALFDAEPALGSANARRGCNLLTNRTFGYLIIPFLLLVSSVAAAKPTTWEDRQGTNDVRPMRPRTRPKSPLLSRDISYSIEWRMPLRDSVCLGLTPINDTLLWVSSGGVNSSDDPNRVLVYNLRTRTLVDSFLQPTTTEYGWRDMSRIGNSVFASDEDGVYEISIPTRAVVNTFIPDTELVPHRAMAAVPGESLLSANWNSRIWKFHRTGNNPHAYDNELQIYGMGYDSRGFVWASTQEIGGHPEIAKLSYPSLVPLDWTELPSPPGDVSGGCEMWRDSFLLVLSQSTTNDEVICVRLYFANRDIGVAEILEPAMPWVGKPTTPKALITNYGISTVGTIAATCSIFGTARTLRYRRDTIITLAGGATATVTFGTWTPANKESCLVKVTVQATADPNPNNDTLTRSVLVRRRTHTGGPDANLYLWVDSDTADPNAPVFSWVDTAGGETLPIAGDDEGVAVTPPFPITYRGVQYETLYVCSNGWIRFGGSPGTNQWVNVAMPNSAIPNNIVAPFWDDCQVGGAYNGAVVIKTIGNAPNRRFVVTFQDVEVNFRTGDYMSFQALFSESAEDIIFQYNDVVVGYPSFDYGRSATVGIENSTGTVGLCYLHNGDPDGNILTSGLAIRFWRPPPPNHDIGVSAITSPTTAGVPMRPRPVTIKTTIRNFGTSLETNIPVICSVFGEENQERWNAFTVIPSIAAGDSVTVTFSGWQPTVIERATIGIYTALIGDELPYNNNRLQVCPVFRAYFTGGPDAMGYRFIDSDTTGGPTYSWSNITSSGTPITFPSSDDGAVTIPLPFTFYFYNAAHNSISVSTNGLLSFQPGGLSGTETENDLLPNPQAPNYLIAPLWDNLDQVVPGRCRYATQGTAPNRVFIISYDSIKFWGAANPFGTGLAFQVKLYETSNQIIFQYRKIAPGAPAHDRGASACVGIENADGTAGLTYENNAWPSGNLLDSARAIRFYPTHDVGAAAFNVPANQSVLAPGTAVSPSAYVRNYGSWNETFQVQLTIVGPAGFNYTSTQNVTNLPPNTLRLVNFSPTTPGLAQGYYTMKLKTLLADPYPQNDSILGSFVVMGAPTGLSPNGPNVWLTSPFVNLDWDDLAGAESYQVEVALDPGFAAVVFNASGLTASQATTDSLADGSYYWRVRGMSGSINGSWSATAQFNIDATPPAAPALLTPPDSAIGVSLRPTFTWTEVEYRSRLEHHQLEKEGRDEVEYYDIQVARDSGFTDLIFTATPQTNSYTHIVDLAYSTTCYWRVRGIDYAGNTGRWGGPSVFTTIHPAAPTLLAPTNGAYLNNRTPTFVWRTSTGANYYELQVSADSLFSTRVISVGLPETTYAPSSSLADGRYYWRVRPSANAGNTWGDFSTVFSFSLDATPPLAPTLLTPGPAAVNVSLVPNFTWTELNLHGLGRAKSPTLDLLDHYDIQLATDPGFSSIVFNVTTTTPAYTHSESLAYLTRYYWRVRGVDDHGNIGPWATDSFTTIIRVPTAPVLVAPPNGTVNHPRAGDLVWQPAARAAWYDVYLDFVYPPVERIATGITATTLHVEDLGGDVTYYWRVVAVNAGGDSSSAIWSFTTVPGPPARPTLVAPESGAVNVPVNGILDWRPTAGATSYNVYLDTVNPPVALAAAGLTETQLDYAGLSHLTWYYWKVVATNAGGSTESRVYSFRTVIAAPATPELRLPADRARNVARNGTLVWLPAERAESYDVYLDQQNPPQVLLAGDVSEVFQRYDNLAYGTTYFWRIVAKNVGGTAQSPVWSFTTIADIPGGWTPRPETLIGTPVKDGGALAYDPEHELIYAIKGNKTNEFWQYSATDSTWTRLPDVGGTLRPVGKGASMTCGAGYVFVIKGNNTSDFYRYSIAERTWTPLRPIPLTRDQTATRGRKVKGGSSLAYVSKNDSGFVYVLKGSGTNDFYRYDIAADTFLTLEPALYNTRPKYDKGSWIVYDGSQFIYLMQNKYNALFRYDVRSGQWLPTPTLAAMPLDSRVTGKTNKKVGDGAAAAWDGSAIYAFKGNNTNQFWKYLPGADNDTWIELESLPQAYPGDVRKKKVKAGGAITYHLGQGVFYALKGNKTNQFWRYKPSGNVFAPPRRTPTIATSENRQPSQTMLSIAPNPLTSRFVTVRLAAPLTLRELQPTISVFDALGRKIPVCLASSDCATLTIDLQSVPAGVYLLQVDTSVATFTEKLVIKH